MRFEIVHTSSKSRARVGRIHTPHGVIDTPGFVAVGTNGTLKSLDNKTVSDIGLQLMFCNTYHLMLHPGTETVKAAGGLHTFIGRDMPIITDSGGFQVFSLAYGSVANEIKSRGLKKHDSAVLKINDDGVLFRSYRDGQKMLLTPETSVQAQKDFGADIIIPFDELPPYHLDQSALERSLARTHEWEKRSLDHHLKTPNNQAMYAVVHGGVDRSLRQKSIDFLTALPFDGYAIGGSLGKSRADMLELVKFVAPRLPTERPNHLLGIGDLESLDTCIPYGVDTFDSSYPTRAARHGMLLRNDRHIKISSTSHKQSLTPIDSTCSCYTCRHYSLAYLHHLYKANELTFMTLATIHNLTFMVDRMRFMREAILADQL